MTRKWKWKWKLEMQERSANEDADPAGNRADCGGGLQREREREGDQKRASVGAKKDTAVLKDLARVFPPELKKRARAEAEQMQRFVEQLYERSGIPMSEEERSFLQSRVQIFEPESEVQPAPEEDAA
jgi:hypothetical protein